MRRDSSLPSIDDDLDVGLAWMEIPKVPFHSTSSSSHVHAGTELGINFHGFEDWWQYIVGIRDPDVPVLPEYLVTKVEEKVKSLASRRATEKGLAPWQTHKLSTWERVVISLRHLVRMQRHWGAKNASLSLSLLHK